MRVTVAYLLFRVAGMALVAVGVFTRSWLIGSIGAAMAAASLAGRFSSEER